MNNTCILSFLSFLHRSLSQIIGNILRVRWYRTLHSIYYFYSSYCREQSLYVFKYREIIYL